MSVSGILHGLTEGIEDLVTFAAVFIFGMIFVGEVYGVYTAPTLYRGIASPFYYPLWIAGVLILIRILDDALESGKSKK